MWSFSVACATKLKYVFSELLFSCWEIYCLNVPVYLRPGGAHIAGVAAPEPTLQRTVHPHQDSQRSPEENEANQTKPHKKIFW